jgi:hypothetical protein
MGPIKQHPKLSDTVKGEIYLGTFKYVERS